MFKLPQSFEFTSVTYYYLYFFCICLSACSTPAQHLKNQALQLNYSHQVIKSHWQHTLYLNNHLPSKTDTILHVYLEGDGTPWRTRYQIATDPTPRNPLMLRLMQYDPNPSIYLGRPCYHGTSHHITCNPLLWTSQRYSPAIVKSMVQALQHFMHHKHYQYIRLIGHSGGGTLAMLMAPHIPQTISVITIAGNLDIDAWTRYHHYSTLKGSLNPAKQPPLNPNIQQIHFAGKLDTNVPAKIIQQALHHQPNAQFILLPHYNHHCCWEKAWPKLITSFRPINH